MLACSRQNFESREAGGAGGQSTVPDAKWRPSSFCVPSADGPSALCEPLAEGDLPEWRLIGYEQSGHQAVDLVWSENDIA